MSDVDATHRELAGWIAESRSAVAFTGAGISTESGIPDFRSPGGVWSKYRPVNYDEFLSSESARHEYWRQKCEMHAEFRAAQPNAGHRALARWEQTGGLRGVVTQNIDGLHQLAGSAAVVELHGTARQAMCVDCRDRVDIEPLIAAFAAEDRPPSCRRCQGRLKHATISFGQPLEEDVLAEAIDWCANADLIIACGSSLVVQPAAGLPRMAKHNGARLAIINRDSTELDHLADVVIHASIGPTLRRIDEILREL